MHIVFVIYLLKYFQLFIEHPVGITPYSDSTQGRVIDMVLFPTATDRERGHSSKAHGETLIEFNHYDLEDVISHVMNVPLSRIDWNGKSYNPKVYFKATWKKNTISMDSIQQHFMALVKENLGIEMLVNNRLTTVYDMKQIGPLNSRGCTSDDESQHSMSFSQINRYFKARCSDSNLLKSKIEEWYHVYIENHVPESIRFNFEIHHTSLFQDFMVELSDLTGVDLIPTSKDLAFLSLQK